MKKHIEGMTMEEYSKKQKREHLLTRLRKYYQSHLWCAFGTEILLALGVIILFMSSYMKNEYYEYLVETTMTTERVLLDSVSRNIRTQMEDFVNIGSGIAVDENLIEEIEQCLEKESEASKNKRMKNALESAASLSNHIVGMALADSDGVLCQYDKLEKCGNDDEIWTKNSQKEVQAAFQSVKEKSASKSVPRYEIILYPTMHPNDKKSGLIHLAFPVKNESVYREIEYMLIITYRNDGLQDLLEQLKQGGENYIQGYLENRGDILFHTRGSRYVGRKTNIYANQPSLTNLEATCGKYGWRLHAVVDDNLIKEKVNAIYMKVVYLYIVAIVVVLAILFLFTNHTMRPVKMIGQSIQKVKNGDIREQLPIEGENEIWQLAQEYNEMLKAIQEAQKEVERQHDEIVESLKMKRRAEREALESQINAHFICNTLNAINYEAIDNGDLKVSILLKKLSNILRYTFDQKHQNVYIFQEISWVEQYLFLQKERMDGVFDYEIRFDQDYNDWPCRKLMLQSFVENSILHGFEGLEEGGKIRIIGEGYQDCLKIVIEDNGCGMVSRMAQILQEILDNPMLAKSRTVGIGISNVIIRMKMYYGEKFRISMETEEGKGTRFTLILPGSEK